MVFEDKIRTQNVAYKQESRVFLASLTPFQAQSLATSHGNVISLPQGFRVRLQHVSKYPPGEWQRFRGFRVLISDVAIVPRSRAVPRVK